MAYEPNTYGIRYLYSLSNDWLSTCSLSSSQSQDDLVTFELGPATSGGQWEARVRDAVRQLSTAAGQPEPSIRYRYLFYQHI